MKYSPGVLLLVLVSCVDVARFEVPQPEGVKDEKSISKKWVGKYLNLTDSTLLLVTQELIVKVASFNTKDALSKIDSADLMKMGSLKQGRVEAGFDHAITDFKIEGDSIFYHTTTHDTLFFQSERFRIRKFKGYYFLNKQIAPGSWEVYKLEKVKEGIITGTISTKQELNELRAVTETYSDTIYRFRPTRKQFKKLLQENGFKTEQKFLRIE
ncbi:MAG: hypothetical protein JST69_08390 [Bacteroidetes bacterium]|nr:hypothetical protein [Bacteroidota bacterium]